MTQGDKTDPSKVPTSVDQNNQYLEISSDDSSNNQQPTLPQVQQWTDNVAQSIQSYLQQGNWVPPLPRHQLAPDYQRNVGHTDYNRNATPQRPPHNVNAPQVPQQIQFQTLPPIPSYIPNQAPMSSYLPMSTPFGPFNHYGIPFGNGPSTSSETQNPYNQLYQNQAMQNIQPPPFQLNQNTPSPVFPPAQPTSYLTGTDTQPSRPYDPNLLPLYSTRQSAVSILASFSDAPKKRRNGERSAFQSHKKKKSSLTSSDYDSTPSTSPHSVSSSEGSTPSSLGSLNTLRSDPHVDLKNPLRVVGVRDEYICVICQIVRKDTVLLPCLHLCVCRKCSVSVMFCPICRSAVTSALTVIV